jgi:hypothetical protein
MLYDVLKHLLVSVLWNFSFLCDEANMHVLITLIRAMETEIEYGGTFSKLMW